MSVSTEVAIQFERRRLSKPAQMWLSSALVLVAIGLVLLFSASSLRAGDAMIANPMRFLTQQAKGVALGVVALVFAANVNPRLWLRVAPVSAVLTLALLIGVLFPGLGDSANGAQRWIRLGGLRFQPSELAKIVVPMLLAWTVSRFPLYHVSGYQVARGDLDDTDRARWHAKRGARIALRLFQITFVGAFVVLIIAEPDLGSGAFVLAVSALLLVVTRLPWPYIATAFAAVIPAVTALVMRRDPAELMQRLNGMLDPQKVHQVWQSLIGIGSGGWFGKGLGHGLAKNYFLPEESNDFIFAVYAEETGFVGVCVLIVLYSILLQSGWRVARDCPHPALRVLGVGIVINLVFQAVMNLAVATASAPTKGIGLPFLSFGSTSLSIAMFQVGLLVGISKLSLVQGRETSAETATMTEAS